MPAEHRDAYDRLHPGLLGEADFLDGYERDSCPSCHSADIIDWGCDGNGIRRWRCKSRGTTFTPATGTIFEDRRLPVTTWAEFLLELLSFESLAEMTRKTLRSPTTLPYQLAKLFLVLDRMQDGVVFSGRV